VAVRPGSEEYFDSEKYQIRIRDWHQTGSLRELIARVNDIRRAHPALQQNGTLAFHGTDNPAFLWYSKSAPVVGKTSASADASVDDSAARSAPGADTTDRVFVVASTTPAFMQHGFVELPIWEMGIAPDTTYVVEDLLDGAQYTWHGAWNYVKLDPAERMAHIFVIRE
jgi:starch synthase (maltosyl-transferring)